ncbi:MAG: hypothetical protein ACXADY_25340 [Candidatus Hodarchaeales archaeon]
MSFRKNSDVRMTLDLHKRLENEFQELKTLWDDSQTPYEDFFSLEIGTQLSQQLEKLEESFKMVNYQ